MNFQFTNPYFLLLLPLALGWVIWLAWKSDVQVSAWRRWVSFFLRIVIVIALVLAIAGLQWKKPLEGMNVTFLLDRSDSIPSSQQEAAREMVNRLSAGKKAEDTVSVLVFGTDSAIELQTNFAVQMEKVHAVVGTERTDIASAIRLGTAAFPETGQRRLILISDGNENAGDAMNALLAAQPLGVRLDSVPMGVARKNDVSVQKISLPSNLKKGQTFDAKIFAQSDEAQQAIVRLYRNEQLLGEQAVELAAGKNLFTFPQTLNDPGFYSYNVQIEAPGDMLPQNNKAVSFTSVRGNPRVLILSSEPQQDAQLASVLRESKLEVKLTDPKSFPDTLAEIQSYDAIFLSNVAAGDLGDDRMKLLESAVRDFGIGLVCIGGDQAFAAGGYRGTALERLLPLDMELSSKKVLPSGSVAMVMHGMEFMNGNEIARQCALGVLEALGPQDEMGIVLWDGNEQWLFPMTKVSNKKELAKKIAGMNQGDLPSFQGVMSMAHEGLKKSSGNIKHMIIFSDGDPGAPSAESMKAIVGDRITVTTVLIAGHAGPETMIWIAEQGKGRFYDVRSPEQLPQIFLKEAAVILKSAIVEEPFKPQFAANSEILRGIGGKEYPLLRGYVSTTRKPRAEIPLLSEKGDPLLAHWNYGLGRAVAFTSDAKPRWATDWMAWEKYKQFWSQAAQWSLRKIENADFVTEVSVESGEGHIAVEAVDEQGNYRNFLDLQTVVVSPKGERQTIRLEQTGPGHYEARFPTKEVGAYLLNLMDLKNGELRGSQVLGASVNYSPEFAASEPNLNLLRRLAESSGGKILDLQVDNPFLLDRRKTFRPQDLWDKLLILGILLFPLDVGIRRILLGREEWQRFVQFAEKRLFFWRARPKQTQSDESLSSLLARRDEVRSKQPVAAEQAPRVIVPEPKPELFMPAKPVQETAKETVIPKTVDGEKPPATGTPETTTSRLLDAKRRAKK
ncbi:MAG: VWA domain-containing protein [Verrucomicrobia bacterium]|nr:VWA domain-containing protein [Verrucomicrobiota bacterium]